MFSKSIKPLVITLSLATAFGIFVHDSRIDKATAAAVALPAILVTYHLGSVMTLLGSDAHTHTERLSLSQAVNDLKAQNPRMQPRSSDDKKHLMQRYVSRGYHPFDSYNTPFA